METLTETIDKIIPKTPNVHRQHSCYRPMVCNSKKIDRICLHNGTDILYTMQSGWLEHQTKNPYDNDYRSNDVTSINIEVRNANKLNLSKKDNFLLKYYDKEKSYWEHGTCLYIYTPDFAFKETVKHPWHDGNTIEVFDLFTVSLPCTVNTPKWNEETEKVEYSDVKHVEIVLRKNKPSEQTEKGQHLRDLLASINESIQTEYYHLSINTLEKILKNFNITKK